MKGPLSTTAIFLAGMYVFLKFILPLFTAPLPASLIYLYLVLTLSATMIFFTMSGASLDAFMGPIGRFLAGTKVGGTAKTARILVLIVFPLLVGWQTYTRLAPSDLPPAENRTIHPAPPGEFVGLSNPYPTNEQNIQEGKERLPNFRNRIYSGELKRVGLDCQSRGCPGNRLCHDGNMS
jgi:hypothetical protein